MELLQGVALDDELRRVGRFPADRALRLLTGVGAAVSAAHARRIVHRDLKPQNIFLCTSGAGEMPKVLDFGLAKALEISSMTALTQQGMVLGTLRYMSPEQFRGAETSVDADLWAFALIALEMLAGSEALDRPPGTVPRLDGLPEPLRQIFTTALALDALDRPTSVDEFLDALSNGLDPSHV
jgi:serine/threonine-protein kinase